MKDNKRQRRVFDAAFKLQVVKMIREQDLSVGQVNEAVLQMDQATQQNAALVEEMAAAAASLDMQARDLVDTVAVFQLGALGDSHSTGWRPQPQIGSRLRTP